MQILREPICVPRWNCMRGVPVNAARLIHSLARRRSRSHPPGPAYPFRGIAGVAKLLNLNVHFHTLVFDGVFTEGEGGALHFRSLPAPTDDEVGVVLATIYVRVCRLLRRQGFDATTADLPRPDPIAEESPMLAGISSASIQGRIALGLRAGRRVWRVGEEPDAPWVLS